MGCAPATEIGQSTRFELMPQVRTDLLCVLDGAAAPAKNEGRRNGRSAKSCINRLPSQTQFDGPTGEGSGRSGPENPIRLAAQPVTQAEIAGGIMAGNEDSAAPLNFFAMNLRVDGKREGNGSGIRKMNERQHMAAADGIRAPETGTIMLDRGE